jgi:hypothetical protein
MSGTLRILCLGLAAAVFASPWSVAADTPFVPADDPEPVPGFKIKMRGERIAYCRIEQKIGTRFKSETCIDQDLMPAYLAALEENREAARQIRTGENRIY